MSNDPNRSVEDRLRDLKSLHNDGVISDDEYVELREPLITQLGAPPSETDSAPPVSLLSPEDERADKRWALFIVLGVIAVLIVVAAMVANRIGGSSTTVREGAEGLLESMGIAPCETTQVVEYVVDGTAHTADITIQTATGITEELTDVPLPWSRILGPMDCGSHLYVSAQNQDKQDRDTDVRCRITGDRRLVAEDTTVRLYGIAVCSGQL